MLNKGDMVGTSDWRTITQDMINGFAELTGDNQWIHVDIEKTGGKTLAHALMIVGFFPTWLRSLKPQLPLARPSRTLNYGYNKVRFMSPIPVNSRVRAHIKLLDMEDKGSGTNIHFEFTVEIEGVEKPAVVAEFITHWVK
jgi:acyl dehydratase